MELGTLVIVSVSRILDSQCVVCRQMGPMLCAACLGAIQTASRPTVTVGSVPVIALGWYAAELRAVIRAAKNYRARAVLGKVRADIYGLFDALPIVPVIPIPPSRPGFLRRGYGLGAEIARMSGRPVVDAVRLADSGTQRGKSLSERVAARRVAVSSAVPDRAILVDDVLTTGATARASIDALSAHGCRVVAVVVLATVPVRGVGVTLTT